jgi:hypothetical protein
MDVDRPGGGLKRSAFYFVAWKGLYDFTLIEEHKEKLRKY